MQPTYLPWAGYFNLIGQVDNFIFLDDVQFERRSWQSRNRILLHGKEYILTVPVNKVERGTQINKITISNQVDWQRKQWQTLNAAYGKAPHGREVLDILEPFFCGGAPELLSDFNQSIIQNVAALLGLETKFFRATDLNCQGQRSIHLINICKSLQCEEYISPRGSKDYLQQDNFSDLTKTRLSFQEYEPAPYSQYQATSFVSHMSIVDVIANAGLEFTKTYIA